MSSNPAIAPAASAPWWKFGHVWLVIAGPAIVIVAGFVTLWLAVSRPDPVVAEDYYRQGIEINKTLAQPESYLGFLMIGWKYLMMDDTLMSVTLEGYAG